MTLFQKLLLLFTALLVAVNIYYECGTNTSERLLNKNTWTKFDKNEAWIKMGNFEIKPFLVAASPRLSDGKFGLQFVYYVETRYLRDDTLASQKLKTDFKAFSEDGVWRLSKDKDGLHHIENIMTVENGYEFYNSETPEYAFLNETKFSFVTSLLPPKVINITSNGNYALAIRTNPLLVFEGEDFKSFYWIAILSLSLFVGASGRAAYFFPMLLLGFGSMGLNYGIWYFLVFVFVFSVVITIKLERLAFAGFIDLIIERPVLSKVLGIILYIFLVGYMFNWELPSKLNFAVFLPFIFAIFIEFVVFLMIFLVTNSIFMLYFYLKYPKQVISNISFNNIRSNFDKGSKQTGKRIPMFYCDAVLNNTIEIKGADISMGMFRKLKKGKQVSVKYFKTDHKGNYLFL